jgi:hypothetical protein
MNNKIEYRLFCDEEKDLPIFFRDWWLDSVTDPSEWDVVLVKKDKNIIAVFPFFKAKKHGFNFIVQPKLTQFSGPWIKYPDNMKYNSKLSYEKKIFNEIIEKLPDFDLMDINFHYSIENWLPFYWKGYKQSTRYTYLIEDLTNLDEVYSNFQSNIKSDIKKAEKVVTITPTDNLQKFYELNSSTFKRQGIDMSYSYEYLRRMDNIHKANDSRRITFAVDEKGNVHSAIYVVWDKNSAYYLMSGSDPEFRSSGATSLLLWEAIQFASTVVNKFDFEGSMIEPIEKFFKGFGAVQKPYFNISKSNSILLNIARILKLL